MFIFVFGKKYLKSKKQSLIWHLTLKKNTTAFSLLSFPMHENKNARNENDKFTLCSFSLNQKIFQLNNLETGKRTACSRRWNDTQALF